MLPAAVNAAVPQSARSYTSMEVLRSPAFWLLYLMLVLVSSSGLMATAQLAPIARDFEMSSTVILFGATTLSVALVVDNVMNGLARPFFGAVSDRIGREYTMALAFTLGALSYWLLALFGHSPWTFVVCAALIFFTWGEIFSLFPSTCTDLFGTRYATANSMMLYYRERHVCLSGAICQRSEVGDGLVGGRIPGGGRNEHAGRTAGTVRAAADAGASPSPLRRPGLGADSRDEADARASVCYPRPVSRAERILQLEAASRSAGSGAGHEGVAWWLTGSAALYSGRAGEHRQRRSQPDRAGGDPVSPPSQPMPNHPASMPHDEKSSSLPR